MLCEIPVTIPVPDAAPIEFTAMCGLPEFHKGKCCAEVETEWGTTVHILWNPEQFLEDLSS